MSENTSYTTEEIARLLKISKLKVYDLIKKGELPSYRVGKQMRVDLSDLEAYKQNSRNSGSPLGHPAPGGGLQELPQLQPAAPFQSFSSPPPHSGKGSAGNVVITGQDMSLDILATHLERSLPSTRPLRSYAGSLDSLIAMYHGESDIVSTHLLDGDTGEYNLPYIRKLLVGFSYIVVHLLTRSAGFYVRKGNPKNIRSWGDLQQSGLTLINRERGSGARVLLDEQLRLLGIPSASLDGYENVENSHLAVAGMVARGVADVGIGTEKAARIVDGIDFIPLTREQYDLVMIKKPENEGWIGTVIDILRSTAFRSELSSIHSYDLTETGAIIYET
ncbi:helix-turn-helix transcriptional regulator [Paenibacillus sp. MMS20-IR301]|uniref:helix-turn-helix transcriptional regulator n=1 Tax=Paenibacillus sp. MMS20-IR301 TaxID=2895946 RepID=UPI0028EFF012|nr:helix-turn-helix transcriptional regulator [Paenibacillus sp. MMS20-IR301]WNS41255.1 helix-turn-helix transcriptional regulator [Paenibacillus sp. MMS20-IR301]